MTDPSRRIPRAVFASICIALIAFQAALAADRHPIVAGFERFGASQKADPTAPGLLLIGELGCTTCHGVSSTIESQINRKHAPLLESAGARLRPDFVRAFLADPQTVKPGTTMPHVLHGLNDSAKKETIEALTHYVLSNGTLPEARPSRKSITAGEALFNQIGCTVCHGKSDGKPLATSIPLPDLGAKYSIPSLAEFLANPHRVRPSGRMPSLNLTAQEAQVIAHYLLKDLRVNVRPNMRYEYFEGDWQKVPDFSKLKPKASGICEGLDLARAERANSFAMRYSGFLRIEKAGQYRFFLHSDDGARLLIDDKLVVDNDGIHPPQENRGVVGLARGAHKLTIEYFDGGGQVELEADIQGPGFSIGNTIRLRQDVSSFVTLTEQEATPPPPGASTAGSARFTADSALVDKGKTLFVQHGCSSCHQPNPAGKSVVAKPLAALGDSASGCLASAPPASSPMYSLNTAQQTAIRESLKSAGSFESKRPTPAQTIARTMTALNCYACHERGQVGGVESERNAWFTTTQKEMGDEGRIPPRLDGVTAKLKPTYLRQALAQGLKDRPYMLTRMPRFGAPATTALADAFDTEPKLGPIPAITFDDTPKRVKSAGRQLVGSDALSCIKCHTFRNSEAEGIQAIDMTLMTKRLNREWFHRYVINPPEFRPGTRMPTAWPNGQTIVPNILGGDTAKQIEAVWLYLSDGSSAMIPAGIGRQPLPLFAIKEAVIYRNFIEGAGTRAIGVGYPERANLAFDANGIRYALLWQGGFMDASRHWSGRGEGFQPPMGDNVIALPDGPAFASLSSPSNPWPTLKAKELGYIFRGYRVTPDQRPTFLYEFGETRVEDQPVPVATSKTPSFKRVITLSSDHPSDTLYFRAALGETIKPTPNGFLVNGEWRVSFDGELKPIVRNSAGKTELIVPVKFNGKTATIVEHIEW